MDQLIDEDDLFGALEVLHPKISQKLRQHTTQLQRKIDTLELKSTKPVDHSRYEALERVNKEMKKQLTCYKEEVESLKSTGDVYQIVENYQKIVNDFNQLYDHFKA